MKVRSSHMKFVITRLLRKKFNLSNSAKHGYENTPEEDNLANELLEKKLLELLKDDPDYLTIPPCPDELCMEFGLTKDKVLVTS